MRKPICTECGKSDPDSLCTECGKSDKVVIVTYGKPVEWRGYECERCHRVVKELFDAYKEEDEEGISNVEPCEEMQAEDTFISLGEIAITEAINPPEEGDR
jgi:hypothetical protein